MKHNSLEFRIRAGSIVRSRKINCFVLQLLEGIKIDVKLPIILCVDNIGVVRMSNNFATTSHTNNIDIYNKYVNKYVEDVVIKIIFDRSGEKQAIAWRKFEW